MYLQIQNICLLDHQKRRLKNYLNSRLLHLGTFLHPSDGYEKLYLMHLKMVWGREMLNQKRWHLFLFLRPLRFDLKQHCFVKDLCCWMLQMLMWSNHLPQCLESTFEKFRN